MEKVSFSHLVSGADWVTSAFDSYRAARGWWRLVLWLHGKPTSPHISETRRRDILADGFRFYAYLYRFLGILFWLTGVACWGAGIFERPGDALCCTLASAITGGFLWFASSLGFSGARSLREGRADARALLCAFMVAIIAFLSGLAAALSVAVQLQTGTGAVLNLSALSVVWALGIGSYLIEVLYLVGEGVAPREATDAR